MKHSGGYVALFVVSCCIGAAFVIALSMAAAELCSHHVVSFC